MLRRQPAHSELLRGCSLPALGRASQSGRDGCRGNAPCYRDALAAAVVSCRCRVCRAPQRRGKTGWYHSCSRVWESRSGSRLNGEQARPGSSRWLTEARHSTANAGHFQPDIAERGATGIEGVDPKGQSGDLERLLLTKNRMLIREQIRIMCRSAVRGFSLEAPMTRSRYHVQQYLCSRTYLGRSHLECGL